MNFSKQFIRKVVYIALITALLIPLSFIGRPSTRDGENRVVDQGGILSQLRNEHDLSQASLSQIDPASETIKLGSLGLRGLAVNLLWMKAIEAKDKKEWDDLTAALETLVKLQPNFIQVWKFQAHNLSYNVSVEFDDYENRYEWVRKGIDFLTGGIDANKRDHRIKNELGFFSGNKFGTADERVQFRRLFRTDVEFHNRMDEFVNINNVSTGVKFGAEETGAEGTAGLNSQGKLTDKDNWLLAHEWYRLAEDMVDNLVDGQVVKLRSSPILFYQYKPAQRRNLMLSLQDEFRIEGEFAKKQWDLAFQEWLNYGRRPMRSSTGLEYNLELEGIKLTQVNILRAQLDELSPGHRAGLRAEAYEKALANGSLTSFEIDYLKRPIVDLDDRERNLVRIAEAKLLEYTRADEIAIAELAPDEHRAEAAGLAEEIIKMVMKMESIERDRSVINYSHWRSRTEAEAGVAAIDARQAEYDATELYRKSIYSSFDEIDAVTGERITKPGAIEVYEQAFEKWAKVFELKPDLKSGPLMEDLVDRFRQYSSIRQEAGLLPWIANHPLQDVIDEHSSSYDDDLITTSDFQQMLQNEEIGNTRSYGLRQRPVIEFKLD